MKRKDQMRLLTGLFLSLSSLFLASCAQEQAATEVVEQTVAVNAVVVQPTDRQITRGYTGALEGEQQAILYARLPEAVQEVRVEEGRSVKAGDVLVTLDKYGSSSQYTQTYSILQNARKNFQKMEHLYNEGATSETIFDAARTEYEVAQAQFESVRQLLEVHTPIDGTVTSVDVSPGDLMIVGQKLATVATTQRLRIKFGVNADDAALFKTGATVLISAEGVATTAEGKVVAVAGSADPISRSFQIEAIINNNEGDFSPGMFVHVDYVLDRLTQVLAIPQASILILNDEAVVFTVVDGRSHRQPIQLGMDLAGDVVVTAGLAAGDTLVTLGQDYLEDGIKLKVTDLQEQTR